MDIEKIIIDTTRGIYNVEEKLSIATLFLFCYGKGARLFSELLYTKDIESFIENLNLEYKDYEVDFSINLKDKLVASCLHKTILAVREKHDNGYYKALYNKDPYAIKIGKMVELF